MPANISFGQFAEDLCLSFLKERGYEILDRNFRRKWGELDLVASKNNIIVFVEVKASLGYYQGFEPENRASPLKMAKVLRTAKTYLAYKKISPDCDWQVDIVAVTVDKKSKSAQIKHFKNVIEE